MIDSKRLIEIHKEWNEASKRMKSQHKDEERRLDKFYRNLALRQVLSELSARHHLPQEKQNP